MVVTLLVALTAFTALFGWLLMLRFQQLRTADPLDHHQARYRSD